jgi:hypothetical protein
MPFTLGSRDKLVEFDKVCLAFGRKSGVLACDSPALRCLYDKLSKGGVSDADMWRRIALAYEIKLGVLQSTYDLTTLAGLENKHWVPKASCRELLDPFSNVDMFGIFLKRARAAFGLISRIRALWDKWFLYMGETYDLKMLAVDRKHSPRRAFFKHFNDGVGPFTSEDIDQYKKAIDELERRYRTPEMHGHGSIRLWAFNPISTWPIEESSSLLGHWNMLNGVIHKSFLDVSTALTSFDEQPGWESW